MRRNVILIIDNVEVSVRAILLKVLAWLQQPVLELQLQL
jgi:hypothetical protein